MIKNYLVKTLFQVQDTDWKVHDRAHETNLFENYQRMHEISLASFQKNLAGSWEFKFVGGNVNNINQAFEQTFWYIHDLWHSEPCNILYTDPDTIAVKPVDIWDKFDRFMMFNYTDPKSFNTPNIYNKSFINFFNAGVRYFPAAMDKDIWAEGAEMARRWDHSTYDTEQIILNTMLWDQKLHLRQALRPELAYQAHMLPQYSIGQSNNWNQTLLSESAIIHVHASRNAESKLQLMQQLYQESTR